MKCSIFTQHFIIAAAFLLAPHFSVAQDTIYTSFRDILYGKVTLVEQNRVYIKLYHNGRVWERAYDKRNIDSIVFANGRVEINPRLMRNTHENIPLANTWSFDVFGLAFVGFSQSYERRLKKGWVGLRIPLYIAFKGGSIAGEGTFQPPSGVYYPWNSFLEQSGTYATSSHGFGIATGFNPKFYLFKNRIVRAFIGPEADIGYTIIHYSYEVDYSYSPIYQPVYMNQQEFFTGQYGTFAAMIKAGLSFSPTDKLSIVVEGGAGVGDVFGPDNPVGWTGIWHIGFALGPNF